MGGEPAFAVRRTRGLFLFDPAATTWQIIPWVPGLEALDRIALDDNGYVWVSVSRKTDPTDAAAMGIFAVDPATVPTAATRFFTTATGLPDNQIYELAKDRRGYMWAATIKGVAVFNDPSGPFRLGCRIHAARCAAGRRHGLSGAVQRGRAARWPWMAATASGLAPTTACGCFSPDADEALLHFTTANSPLPSNRIVDVKVNDKTGEVWVATDAGVVALPRRGHRHRRRAQLRRGIPQPRAARFRGHGGHHAAWPTMRMVKITDVAGHLVYATTANGGTVTWNLTTPDGQRVRSGIYLVLSADADGKNGCVSKVAVLSK